MNDETINKIAAHKNIGDLALCNDPTVERRALINRAKLKQNILPKDVINRANPELNYQFCWVPMGDSKDDRDFRADVKDEGYKACIESEWLCNYETLDWLDVPASLRPRWSVTKMLTNGRDEFLAYREQALYDAQREEYATFNERRIEGRTSADIEQGLKSGVSIEGSVLGREVDVRAPKTRTSVS